MAWYYLYDKTTGKLVSESSEPIRNIKSNHLVVTKTERIRKDQEWDEKTKNFKIRPKKILIDRLKEARNHLEWKKFFTNLPAPAKSGFNKMMIDLLGKERYRNETEKFIIKDTDN